MVGKSNQMQTWGGFDAAFWEVVTELSKKEDTEQQLRSLGAFTFSGIKPYPFSLPLMVRTAQVDAIERFLKSYLRLLQMIISQYRDNSSLRSYVTLPKPLAGLAVAATPTADNIDLCRVDLFLDQSGDFKLLETNANCPGGIIYAGIAASIWRQIIPNLRAAEMYYERPTWMADWFLDEFCTECERKERFNPIMREAGGHELELSTHRDNFLRRGVDCELLDPRSLTSLGNAVCWNGRHIRAAYQKIGIPEFCLMAEEMRPYIDSVLDGRLRVQNGVLGRWVGDNKLCLAVLSDPRFEDLFPEELLSDVRRHLPWSRNIAWCSDDEIQQIRKERTQFVLKRPLDTRGRGVAIGKDVPTEAEWNALVDTAAREGWLCMQYVATTGLQRPDLGGGFARHDLAVASVNGRIVGGYSRSSQDERVNVALNGRLHPLFFAARS